MTLLSRILSHIARYIVVSSGASGNWTWKKYADGWCEMEYYYSANNPLAVTNAYANYYISAKYNIGLPFNLISAPEIITVSVAAEGADFATSIDGTYSNISFLWANGASYTTRSRTVRAYVCGRWK